MIKKLLLQKFSHFHQGVQNWISEQETELSKQEMELFIPLPALWSKNFLYKMFHIFNKEFEIVFWNRKWNYLKFVQCPPDIEKVSSSLAVRLIKSRKKGINLEFHLRRKFENSNLLAEDFPLFPCLIIPNKWGGPRKYGNLAIRDCLPKHPYQIRMWIAYQMGYTS